MARKSDRQLSRSAPEEQELKRKLAESYRLEAELADKELYFANLQTELLPFETRYLRNVGARYAELDEIQAQMAELYARNHPQEDQAQEAAARARLQANKSKAAAGQPVPEEDDSGVSPTLKSLYREVAKRIHPDLGADAGDRVIRERLMAEANRAYQWRNETRLRAILEEYEFSPQTVRGEGPAAELVRVVRKIAQQKGRLADIEREIRQTMYSDLFQLKVKAAETATEGRDLLGEMAATVEAEIAAARAKLEELAREAPSAWRWEPTSEKS
ncbi:MAG TPA: hypothetical protein VGS20_14645 [Candidatus Acidoferrales bacterium]|nr:hypothetical protein [Candidatus Acidoferrales bacterium]